MKTSKYPTKPCKTCIVGMICNKRMNCPFFNNHLKLLAKHIKILTRFKHRKTAAGGCLYPMPNNVREGWTWLVNTRKWHYFVKKISLCEKWMIIGNPDLEEGNDNSPDNCKVCQKKLAKRK